MAIVKRFISYALPEDVDSDKIQLWESSIETGTFTLDTTLNYSYGARATEVDSINTEMYYKIRFRNSEEGTNSAFSDVFFGGNTDEREPFATVSTSFDGAGYGTVSGVYATSNLSTSFVPVGDVQKALKISRAYIDIRTGDQGPNKYARDWGTDITRRKYNAQLEMIKACEENYALAIIYRNLADDQMTDTISNASGWMFGTGDVEADASGGAPLSPGANISATDVTLSSGVTVPSDLSLSLDISPTGLATSTDVIASTDLELRSDITASSGSFNDLSAGASISVGQTSISDIIRSNQGVSREDTRAEEHNVNKDININDHNDNKHIATSGYNDEKNIDLSQHNSDLFINTQTYNDDKNLDETKQNIAKDTGINEHNDNKSLEEKKFNLEKDLAIDERNTQKAIDIARFNLERELKTDRFNLEVKKFNHQKNIDMGEYLDEKAKKSLAVSDLYDQMSRRYSERGDELLRTFMPSTVTLRYGEDRAKSKFLDPTTLFTFSMTDVSIESVFTLYTSDLTGLGDDFNSTARTLDAAFMVNNPVEGVNGIDVVPLESRTTLVDSKLNINGVNYFLDEWVDNNGVTQDGVTQAGTSGGYRLSYDTGVNAVSIEWLYNDAAGGFDLESGDLITFNYYVIE